MDFPLAFEVINILSDLLRLPLSKAVFNSELTFLKKSSACYSLLNRPASFKESLKLHDTWSPGIGF